MPIISTGLLLNQIPGNCPIGNPMEGEKFQFQILFMPPPTFISLISFALLGDVPKDLQISPTGLITGAIQPYNNQTSTSGLVSNGDSEIDLTGANYDATGRPDIKKFEFNFNIVYDTMIMAGTTPTPLKEISPVKIKLLHNYTLDNEIFLKKYVGKVLPEGKESMRKEK
jgi:hypothetical protein